jgi:hypothetical protein
MAWQIHMSKVKNVFCEVRSMQCAGNLLDKISEISYKLYEVGEWKICDEFAGASRYCGGRRGGGSS